MNQLEIGGHLFTVSRPHHFGLVIHGLEGVDQLECGRDYLHEILLTEATRGHFFEVINEERLVVCKNVASESPTYQKVRGKSSFGRLSQAEYYHHDGCSCPTKPRFNEIRFPHQPIARNVATAIAPFGDVVKAQLDALPERIKSDERVAEHLAAFETEADWPDAKTWDRVQGLVTRMVRKELDAEGAREYFRDVDRLAGAYDALWEMGESRFMLNDHDDLRRTMQHRRSYQQPKQNNEQNGSLVKRWTAEVLAGINLKASQVELS